MDRIPQHLAMIMDGNRRWARQQGLAAMKGHSRGAEHLKKVVAACLHRGIGHLSLFALSTENLGRADWELAHLFGLIEKIANYSQELCQKGVRLKVLGNMTLIPPQSRKALQDAMELTSSGNNMILNLAVAYGGREEILRAAARFSLQPGADIQEQGRQFQSLLDTASCPPVDLLIRTGGHSRLSNFLLWQSAYAELYFTPCLWPDFDEEQLDLALKWYSMQEIKLGL